MKLWKNITTEIEVLKRKNLLLQNIVNEMKGRNSALEMNVNLLLEKVHNLEIQKMQIVHKLLKKNPLTARLYSNLQWRAETMAH